MSTHQIGISDRSLNMLRDSASFSKMEQVRPSHLKNKPLLDSTTGRERKLKKVCQDFEAIFIYQMLRMMRATVPESELLKKSPGHDMFEGMLDEELAKKISTGGNFGIAGLLYRQMRPRTVSPSESRNPTLPAENPRSGTLLQPLSLHGRPPAERAIRLGESPSHRARD